ncbi:hypothetical protein DERP_000933 [Dermatophagoides pteronyssinus]|uniref:Uncharacterized protein n=1 Tax=Dermatophagoides pteronyssinus TaxID=6956 RepID=A0ABQ8JDJ9_DERPT|nr:hypothetical protein DERP_000933 [Dermatophagoides pteronyssinus]
MDQIQSINQSRKTIQSNLKIQLEKMKSFQSSSVSGVRVSQKKYLHKTEQQQQQQNLNTEISSSSSSLNFLDSG